MVNKYGHSGWYKESRRHSLAAQGVSTNRYFRKKHPMSKTRARELGLIPQQEMVVVGDKTYLKGSEPQFKPRGEEYWRDQALRIGLSGQDVEDYVRIKTEERQRFAAGSGKAVESDIQDIMKRNELNEKYKFSPDRERKVADAMKQYLRDKLRLEQLRSQAGSRRGLGLSMLKRELARVERIEKSLRGTTDEKGLLLDESGAPTDRVNRDLAGNVKVNLGIRKMRDMAAMAGNDVLAAQLDAQIADLSVEKSQLQGRIDETEAQLGDTVTAELQDFRRRVQLAHHNPFLDERRHDAVEAVFNQMSDVINRKNISDTVKVQAVLDARKRIAQMKHKAETVDLKEGIALQREYAEMEKQLAPQLEEIRLTTGAPIIAGVVKPKAGSILKGVESVRVGGVEGRLPKVLREERIGLREKELPFRVSPEGAVLTSKVQQQKFGEAAPERDRSVAVGKKVAPFERESEEEKMQRARGFLPDVFIGKTPEKIDLSDLSVLANVAVPVPKAAGKAGKRAERAVEKRLMKKAERYGKEEAELKEKRRTDEPEGGGLSEVEKLLASQTVYSGGGVETPKVYKVTGEPIKQASYTEQEKERRAERRAERKQLQARMRGTKVVDITKKQREAAPILRNPKPVKSEFVPVESLLKGSVLAPSEGEKQ